jgi:dipeptidyl aminopeptidase/acylaminoacyl peptidase
MKSILFILFISCAFPGFSQGKKPITHEDMWLLKRVGAPAISPNGKWVICSVQEPSYDDKEVVNDIWLTPADGSAKPRKITGNKGGESGYAWSPDSKQIAFTAKRDADEVAQVYLMNLVEGGEAQRLTNISTGASSPQWSPDSKMILFSSSVYPTAFTDSANKKIAEEKKKEKYKARVYTSFPIREWDHWIDEKRTHFFVQSIEAGSKEKDIFTNMPMVKEVGFNVQGSPAWTADSKGIVLAAVTEGNTAAFQDVPAKLFKIELNGLKGSMIMNDSLSSFTSPKLSADGKSLYCLQSAERNYKVYNINRLVKYDWPSLQHKQVLTASLDRYISSYDENGQGIVLGVEDQGNDKLMLLPYGSNTVQPLSPAIAGCFTNVSVSEDGNTIVANLESTVSPPEVVRVQAGQTAPVYLSSFNTEKLATLDLTPAEDVWFTSSRGKKIHSLLIRPAGFDPSKKYPLLVLMHGGPASAWKHNWSYRWNYQLLSKPGYIMICTNYTGSTGFGEKFAQEIQFDPFKGPGDELNEAAADAIKRFAFIDGNNQAAAGASYGGHLANWLQATTTHYKCLISHAGLVNSEVQYGTSDGMYGREVMNGGTPWEMTKTFAEQNPMRYAAKWRTPMLVTVGEQDYRVPVNNSIENWTILQRMKIPSKLIVFPEENHWILKAENSRFYYAQVHEWLAKYLLK